MKCQLYNARLTHLVMGKEVKRTLCPCLRPIRKLHRIEYAHVHFLNCSLCINYMLATAQKCAVEAGLQYPPSGPPCHFLIAADICEEEGRFRERRLCQLAYHFLDPAIFKYP